MLEWSREMRVDIFAFLCLFWTLHFIVRTGEKSKVAMRQALFYLHFSENKLRF